MGSGFAVMAFNRDTGVQRPFQSRTIPQPLQGAQKPFASSVTRSIPAGIELNSETRLVHLSRRAGRPRRGLDIRRVLDVHGLQVFRCEPFPDFQANFFGQIDELDASFFLRAACPGNFSFGFEPLRGSGKLKAKVDEGLGWQELTA